MGEVVQFVPRHSVDRKPMTQPRCHDDLTGDSVLDYTKTLDGPFYESSLGYVAPNTDPA